MRTLVGKINRFAAGEPIRVREIPAAVAQAAAAVGLFEYGATEAAIVAAVGAALVAAVGETARMRTTPFDAPLLKREVVEELFADDADDRDDESGERVK